MRSAYPAVFFCALACASAPSTARLSTTGGNSATATIPVSSEERSGRGHIMTGSFLTEYYSGETLHDVLRRRAPLYLRARAIETFGGKADPIAVYINGNFSGSVDVLSSIPAYDVFSVERITATAAVTRFGPKHGSGALLVTLVRHD